MDRLSHCSVSVKAGLIELLSRHAERLAMHLMRHDEDDAQSLGVYLDIESKLESTIEYMRKGKNIRGCERSIEINQSVMC